MIFCYADEYSLPGYISRRKNAGYYLIEMILKHRKYCENTRKSCFDRVCVMARNENFKTSNKCHICGKTYDLHIVPVTDHCHVTGKHRNSGQKECITSNHEKNLCDGHFLMKKLVLSMLNFLRIF